MYELGGPQGWQGTKHVVMAWQHAAHWWARDRCMLVEHEAGMLMGRLRAAGQEAQGHGVHRAGG